MFFADRLISIKPNDRVLEIGPGATPYFRSDVFLEREYDSKDELIAQSGRVGLLETVKPVIKYSGNVFPFQDKEFDYVVCSHVLEHVDNADSFLKEVQRVGKKGYLEFPTIYYDYIYNFPEHQLFLLNRDGVINWMTKSETRLSEFGAIQKFFFETCNLGYFEMIDAFREYFFQGFEWFEKIDSRRVSDFNMLTYDIKSLKLSPKLKPVSNIDYSKISLKQHLKFKFKAFINYKSFE